MRQTQAELDELRGTQQRESENSDMMIKELQLRQAEHRALAEERGKAVDALQRLVEDLKRQVSLNFMLA